MAAFVPLYSEDPRSELLNFIGYFEMLMNELSGSSNVGNALPSEMRGLWLPETLMGAFYEAWLSARQRLGELKRRVEGASLEQLDAHGLTGAELRFKMEATAHYSRQVHERPTRFFLKKLLGVIDPALQSLLDSVGLGGALAELKGTAEAGLEED